MPACCREMHHLESPEGVYSNVCVVSNLRNSLCLWLWLLCASFSESCLVSLHSECWNSFYAWCNRASIKVERFLSAKHDFRFCRHYWRSLFPGPSLPVLQNRWKLQLLGLPNVSSSWCCHIKHRDILGVTYRVFIRNLAWLSLWAPLSPFPSPWMDGAERPSSKPSVSICIDHVSSAAPEASY